ncbi:MAG TPA: PLP-dependent aminotransferase family protein [Kofleriaceae bacterium]|jgi:2-aminoadipate transaminase
MHPRIDALLKAAAAPDVIGLAGGLPAAELMPRAEIERALADAARDDKALQYGWPEGLADLRAWIAARLNARGADVRPEHVIVTTGAQQALLLIALAHRGAQIAVGEASYPAALAAFRRAGLDVVGDCTRGRIPLPRRPHLPPLRDTDCAHYVMPGIANPLGVDLVEPWRQAWLAQHALIADEAYTELRFDGGVARPLYADAPDRVWHVGTLSKTLCPGLRVGWLVPPIRDHELLLDHKEAADLQTASLTQAAAALLVSRIDYDALLEKARHAYADRAATLCQALRAEIPDAVFVHPEGGFSVWVELPYDDGDDIDLLECAVNEGTSIDPGRLFRPRAIRNTAPLAFRASFSSAPIEQLPDAARRLGRAIGRWRSQPVMRKHA